MPIGRHAILFALVLCTAASPALGDPRSREVMTGGVSDFDPTSAGLHDYTPPTPVARGHGNAYFGAGYMEFLFSGSRTPQLPPRRVYVGPMESEPYGNRRLRLREGMSPRAGVYIGLPEGAPLLPHFPY